MSNQTQQHQGGPVAAPKGDGPYRNFEAYQHDITQRIGVVVVAGEVVVGNPGVEVKLSYAVPQGTNPNILLLHIEFYQRPGAWPQHTVVRHVNFSRFVFDGRHYSEADIVSGEVLAVRVPVKRV